jgi:transcriptional regulator with XRE-family HTH domain
LLNLDPKLKLDLNNRDALLELRKQRHLTQKALCAGICSASSYARFEIGDQMLRIDQIYKILERLGITKDCHFMALFFTSNYEAFILT